MWVTVAVILLHAACFCSRVSRIRYMVPHYCHARMCRYFLFGRSASSHVPYDFSYRKPIWVQMIKDPNSLPFTAETSNTNTRVLEPVEGTYLQGRFSRDNVLPRDIEQVTFLHTLLSLRVTGGCCPRKATYTYIDTYLGIFIEIRDTENFYPCAGIAIEPLGPIAHIC